MIFFFFFFNFFITKQTTKKIFGAFSRTLLNTENENVFS